MKRTLIVLGLVACAAAAEEPAAVRRPTNAALGYWRAFAVMKEPDDAARLDALRAVAEGQAPWDPSLADDLSANADALAEMRRASRLAECDFGLNMEDGFSLLLPHLAKARSLARLNAADGERLFAGGRKAEAVEAWLAGVRFGAHLSQDQVLISHLIAKVLATSGFRALTRHAAALEGPELAKIAEEVGAIPAYGWDWGVALEGERRCAGDVVRSILAEKDPVDGIRKFVSIIGTDGGGGLSVEDLAEQAGVPVADVKDAGKVREYFERALREYDAMLDRVEAAMRMPGWEGIPELTKIGEEGAGKNVLIQLLMPATTGVGRARAELEVERAGLLGVVALARHRLEKGQDSATLAGMDLPLDPFSGKPFELRVAKDGLALWSAGSDGTGRPYSFELKR
ncbi:MAG: hypothetical protein HYY18_11755 [Planctomycetes bacterium]|nr:hypothetical protein [Planctomycetota bacterium]